MSRRRNRFSHAAVEPVRAPRASGLSIATRRTPRSRRTCGLPRDMEEAVRAEGFLAFAACDPRLRAAALGAGRAVRARLSGVRSERRGASATAMAARAAANGPVDG